MQRFFNTEGQCDPDVHYMVCLDERLERMKRLFVDRGKYFVVSRGRQYGKTTTLTALAKYLRSDYRVVLMDFQMMSSDSFESESNFVKSFVRYFASLLEKEQGDDSLEQVMACFSAGEQMNMQEMFAGFSRICEFSEMPMVLIVDEVDYASNYQVFLDFLALLRAYYIDRKNRAAFYSVILAGVYDIKNLKLKFRPQEERQYGSPWNIAASFDMDMDFSADQIAGMLDDYEADRHTGMDVQEAAGNIYAYTSGYPYLVSAVCKLIDEEICDGAGGGDLGAGWTKAGIREAVKRLLNKQLPIFQSMMHQLNSYSELKQMLNALLFQGKRITFNPDNPVIHLAAMFGYIVNREGSVQVANRIFETRLYNYFLSEEELTNAIYDEAQGDRNGYFSHGGLDMKMVLEKFVMHFSDIYGAHDEKFIEKYGRKFFLLYLKPIINGRGNYYIEAQTRDARRTDVIVDYAGEQFIIELKIWRGNEYNEMGRRQLAEYLEDYHQQKGYLLSFNFNRKKECGVKEVQVDGKTIVEAVV